MIHDTSTLPDSPQELKQIIVDLQCRYKRENELLREQVRLLYARIFGKKSEKGQMDSTAVQLPLFDMPETEVEPEKKEVEVHGHTRQKAGRAGNIAAVFLKGYTGVVQTDGYAGVVKFRLALYLFAGQF
ncbi:MAG: hypothetical protein ABIJ50_11280 [Pseudomonadota bacterium]